MDVTQTLLYVLAVLGFAWLTVNVHEYGHLAVGRWVGVPADSIRVRYTPRPPHVALRAGQTWLAPDDPDYASTFQRFNGRVSAAWVFVAGGFLVESVVVLAGAAALVPAAPAIAVAWLGTSTAILLLYVVTDLIGRVRTGVAAGDASALAALHTGATVGILLLITIARGLVLGWAITALG